jgi:hypothetical protein
MSSDNAETTIPIESNTTTNIVTTAESDSTTSKGLTSSSSSAFEPTALDAPGTSSTTEVTTATITSTTATAVDNAGELAEQARVIRDLDQGDGKVLLVEGANWYLISCSWVSVPCAAHVGAPQLTGVVVSRARVAKVSKMAGIRRIRQWYSAKRHSPWANRQFCAIGARGER